MRTTPILVPVVTVLGQGFLGYGFAAMLTVLLVRVANPFAVQHPQ